MDQIAQKNELKQQKTRRTAKKEESKELQKACKMWMKTKQLLL